MIVLSGKSVCGGIAFGRISIYRRGRCPVKRRHIENTDAEIARYAAAKERAAAELDALYHKAVREIGEAEAQIFSIHKMMLEDADYSGSVESIIAKQNLNSEAAVLMTAEAFSKMLAETEDAYMQARAGDVCDVSDRLIAILSDTAHTEISAADDECIVLADDLAPSETLQMDKSKITAFVTERGSTASHTAILARSLNLPALIGVKCAARGNYDGKTAAVDGYSGKLYIEPTEAVLKELREKKREKDALRELLKELKDKPTETADGRKIRLYANIGAPSDLGSVIINDAEGIGLFRSEFLYLQSQSFPSEDVQFGAYKRVAEGMGEKPVIIRTLDIGADKKIGYFNLPHEENPALGMRAIRICLTETGIFKTQLRAILRASAFGSVMIMLPMIVSVDEVKRSKEILEVCKRELRAEKIAFDEHIPVGIMIETPAAAIISDKLAEEADFFSIGTNDLSQYMLAADRQNDAVSNMMDFHHEAILRIIKTVIDNSHKKGIWTGVCGELGADTEIIPRLIGMGIDELSVSPGKILEIRRLIREDCLYKGE